MGWENWPKCGGTPLPPLSAHALIEFGIRAVSGVVGVITVITLVLAWTRRPFRRDLLWLALLLPLGVVAQAVPGGFTVLHHLAPGFEMGALQPVVADPRGCLRPGLAEHVSARWPPTGPPFGRSTACSP